MKKIILAIVALMTSCLVSFADTSLESAFDQLSNLKGMSEKNVGKIMIGEKTYIRNARTASVSVDQDNIGEYRDKFVWMTENLPVRQMVIGANNRRELGAVYATPTASGDYSVLIFNGNAITGKFSVTYGQTTAAGVAEIQSSDLEMNNMALTITPESEDNAFLTVSAY